MDRKVKNSVCAGVFSLIVAAGFSAPSIAGHSNEHDSSAKPESSAKVCPHNKAHGDGKKCEHHGHCKHGRIARKLGLTDEQKEQFRQVMKEQYAKKQEIIEASGIRESLENLHAETVEKLDSVLSDEQLEKFEKHHARHKKDREHKQCQHD